MKYLMLFALLVSPISACANWEERIAARVVESTVRVDVGDLGGGSGSIIAPGNRVLTCAHLFDAPGSTNAVLTVTTLKGASYRAEIVYRSEQKDLAILQIIGDVKLPALSLAPRDSVTLGERVLLVGHPLGMVWTVTTGIVSAVRRDVGLPNLYVQTTAVLAPGSSGGPLVDRHGRIIGVAALCRTDYAGFYLAVHLDEIYAFFNEVTLYEQLNDIFGDVQKVLLQ